MIFSYDRAWADVKTMAQTHSEIMAVMAGVFLLLPDFIRELFLPMPPVQTLDQAGIATLLAYFQANGVALFLLNLFVFVGGGAILGLLLDARKPTVAQAITTAFVMLPSIIVLNWLMQVAIVGGLLLFLAPGIYLAGRLAVASAWQMASRSMNPLSAITESIALTRGQGWRIAGMIVLVFVVAAIATRAIGAVIGLVLFVILPTAILPQVVAFLSAILSTVVLFIMLLLTAAIYRQLAPSSGT